MDRKTLVIKSISAFAISCLIPSAAHASSLSFEVIALEDSEFVAAPTQSQDGNIRVSGDAWGSLQISRDAGLNYTPTNPSGVDPEQIDWKQISVSSDGQRIVASSSRGNSGGYIFLSRDAGSNFQRIDALGNANWTGAIFGTDANEILVLDGVSTIWGNAANGSNCDTGECVGSGADGSNLESRFMYGNYIPEQPFAAVFYSQDLGASWSETVTVPAGDPGVQYAIAPMGENFILKKSELGSSNSYFQLSGLTRPRNNGSSEPSTNERMNISSQKFVFGKMRLEALAIQGFAIQIDNMQEAGFGNISSQILNRLNQDLTKDLGEVENKAERIQSLIAKWVSVEKIMTSPRVSIYDLELSGLAPSNLPFKATLLRALNGVSIDERSSFEKLSILIESVVSERQSRRERLAKRLLLKSR